MSNAREDFPEPVVKSPHATTFFVAHPEALEAVSAIILPIRDDPEKVVNNKAGKYPPCRPEQLGLDESKTDLVGFQDQVVGALYREAAARDIAVLTLSFPGFLLDPEDARAAATCALMGHGRYAVPDADTWGTLWDAYYEDRPH